MHLVVYNTLKREKEPFVPRREGSVGIYVCGPTVYGHSHLGHAKSYVSFDVVVRYLRFIGYNVLYVQNITDVGHLLGDANEGEDRILMQSRVEQKHPMEIAEEYTRSYFEDMDTLGLLRPDISPRASGHITEQIEIVERLISKGFAYEANGSVYFAVDQSEGYGKLSGRKVDELEAGARVSVKGEKRHPADFALWKKAEPAHLMRWPSPWGVGFPGWHVECSAMAMKYLGESFDIHGGGLENQFPHHECEIAQSEGATGKPFVKYWLHNNMVTVNGQKMGKSLGNFTTLKEAFRRWDPGVIRLFILQSHYRSPLDFSNEAIEAAAAGLERLGNTVRGLKDAGRLTEKSGAQGLDLTGHKAQFLGAMDDDFNTPQAVAVLFDLSREINSRLGSDGGMKRADIEMAMAMFNELAGRILGLNLEQQSGQGGLEDGLMEIILEVRQELRAQKNWALSDRLRDLLLGIGVAIEDKKEGASWKRTNPSS